MRRTSSMASCNERRTIAGLSLVCAGLLLLQSPATATPPTPSTAATAATAPTPSRTSTPPPPTAAASPSGATPAAAEAAPDEPAAPSTTAQITFTTMPPTEAIVTWGKTRLGRITATAPLVVVRPRDSGPLDVVVRAEGFLAVQTRAHTFADTRVAVKLTRPTEASTLLGYRVPIEPKPPATPAPGELLLEPAWSMTPEPTTAPTAPAPTWDMTAPQNMTNTAPAR